MRYYFMGSVMRLNLKGCYNYKDQVCSSVTVWCAMSAELDLSTLQSLHFVVQTFIYREAFPKLMFKTVVQILRAECLSKREIK